MNVPDVLKSGRQTRSKRLYATWDGPQITTANPDFDFAALLQARIQANLDRELDSAGCQEDDDHLFDQLFSLSPLSSPDATPPTSPEHLPASPPQILNDDLDLDPSDTPRSAPIHLDTVAVDQPASPTTHCTASKSEPNVKKSGKRKHSNSSHNARAKKRAKARAATYGHYTVREGVKTRYIDGAVPVECTLKTEESNVTANAHVAKDDLGRSRRVFPLSAFIGEDSRFNFDLVRWNGKTSIPITDAHRRLVVLLAGHPNDANWPKLQLQAAAALEQRRAHLTIPKKNRVHRRGAFPAVPCGVSHGGGQPLPSNLSDPANAAILQELNEMEAFKRIAGFSSACMANWAPELYGYYVEKLGKLHEKHPNLKRIFPSSVFSAASYNFGPRTVCFKHTDFANLPFGWCAVTALGSFDPSKGGHLVLWDLRLVIEFPPGSVILLPSAIIAHSNVPVSNNETRYSFAQYSAGGLFRWVDNDFKKAVDYYASLSPERLLEVQAENAARWKMGLSLLPILKKPLDVSQS